MNTFQDRLQRAFRFAALILTWRMAGAQESPPAADESDALYTMGLNLGQQLRQNGVAVDVPMGRIEQGIKDGLAGKRTVGADQIRLQAYLQAAAAAAAARNTAAAHEFLERNAKAPGVATTASGLQYKIIAEGNPKSDPPKPADLVTLRFKGTLLDGTEFDSSAKPGTAAVFQVSGVIKAWQEALSLMRPGARWRLFVPPELGYGQATRAGIPGGSLLIFDLELQAIQPSPPPPKLQ